MISKNKFGFVILRDSHLLVTNELQSKIFGNQIKYSINDCISHSFFLFPLSNTAEVIFDFLTSFYVIETIREWSIEIFKEAVQETGEVPKLLIINQVLATMGNTEVRRIQKLIKEFSKENEAKFPILLIPPSGLISEGTISFKEDGEGTVHRQLLHAVLPMQSDSEWGVAYELQDSLLLSAALKSTSTKEELLDVLIKTNIATEEKWIPYHDFIDDNQILDKIKKRKYALNEIILNTFKEQYALFKKHDKPKDEKK